LLNKHDQEIIQKYLFEIRKPIALNEVELPEPQHVERNMRVLNFTEGILVVEAGIKLSADSECYEQRVTAAGQIIIRLFFTSYEIFLK